MQSTIFTSLLLAIFNLLTLIFALPANINTTYISTLEPRWIMAAPRCTPLSRQAQCMLGTYQKYGQDQASVSVFNNKCKMLGFNGELPTAGYSGLESQLPYVCVVLLENGLTGNPFGDQQAPPPSFMYAGSGYTAVPGQCYGDGQGATYCMIPFVC